MQDSESLPLERVLSVDVIRVLLRGQYYDWYNPAPSLD